MDLYILVTSCAKVPHVMSLRCVVLLNLNPSAPLLSSPFSRLPYQSGVSWGLPQTRISRRTYWCATSPSLKSMRFSRRAWQPLRGEMYVVLLSSAHSMLKSLCLKILSYENRWLGTPVVVFISNWSFLCIGYVATSNRQRYCTAVLFSSRNWRNLSAKSDPPCYSTSKGISNFTRQYNWYSCAAVRRSTVSLYAIPGRVHSPCWTFPHKNSLTTVCLFVCLFVWSD